MKNMISAAALVAILGAGYFIGTQLGDHNAVVPSSVENVQTFRGVIAAIDGQTLTIDRYEQQGQLCRR